MKIHYELILYIFEAIMAMYLVKSWIIYKEAAVALYDEGKTEYKFGYHPKKPPQ